MISFITGGPDFYILRKTSNLEQKEINTTHKATQDKRQAAITFPAYGPGSVLNNVQNVKDSVLVLMGVSCGVWLFIVLFVRYRNRKLVKRNP